MNKIYHQFLSSPNLFIVIGALVAFIGFFGVLNPGGSNTLSAFNILIGGYLIGWGVAFKLTRQRF